MTAIYYDTEFLDDGVTISLISIGNALADARHNLVCARSLGLAARRHTD